MARHPSHTAMLERESARGKGPACEDIFEIESPDKQRTEDRQLKDSNADAT